METKSVSKIVCELEFEYGGVDNLTDDDERVFAIRKWFDPAYYRGKKSKGYSYDNKIIELYNKGLTDTDIASEISKSVTTVSRSRARLGLGKTNAKKPKYLLCDSSGIVGKYASVNEVLESCGLTPNSYSFKRTQAMAKKCGYKLERID